MKIVSKVALAAVALLAASGAPLERAEATLPTAQQLQTTYNAAALPPFTVERTLTLQRGETLAAELKQVGFNTAQLEALTKANPATRAPCPTKPR